MSFDVTFDAQLLYQRTIQAETQSKNIGTRSQPRVAK